MPGLFNHTVLTSPFVAASTVIGIVPQGLATGYDGSITIDITGEPTVHMEDTAPTDISDSGSAVAFPSGFDVSDRIAGGESQRLAAPGRFILARGVDQSEQRGDVMTNPRMLTTPPACPPGCFCIYRRRQRLSKRELVTMARQYSRRRTRSDLGRELRAIEPRRARPTSKFPSRNGRDE